MTELNSEMRWSKAMLFIVSLILYWQPLRSTYSATVISDEYLTKRAAIRLFTLIKECQTADFIIEYNRIDSCELLNSRCQLTLSAAGK